MLNNIFFDLTILQNFHYHCNMKRKLINVICTLIFSSSISILWGQQPVVRNFDIESYNGGTQNWCITQGADNRMMFANNNGLLLFDSENWELAPVTNHTNVRSVFFDKERGVVYAGASNELGYFKIDSLNHTLAYISLMKGIPPEDRFFEEIWNIYKYNNTLAFQSKRHIFVLMPQGRFKVFHLPYRIETSAVVEGKIIIACKEALYYIFNNELRPLNHTEPLKGQSVRAILPYKGGNLLLATASQGLFLYDGFSTRPLELDISPFLKENQIFCAAYNDNMLAIGTVRGGLVVKELTTGRNSYSNIYTGLQNNTVLSLFFDDRNNIWLGLDQGISYVLIDAPYKEMFGGNNLNGSGYCSLIYQDKLYMGTNQGLFAISYPVSGGPLPPTPALVAGMAGQVWSIRAVNGSLLCGNNEGAYQIEGMRARKIEGPQGTWDYKLLSSHPGYLLSCDYQSLYILQQSGGRWSFRNRIAGFGEISAVFEEDSDGTIWISHWQKGIYHLWLSPDLRSVKRIVHYGTENLLPTNDNNIVSKTSSGIHISTLNGFFCYDATRDRLLPDERLNKIFAGVAQPMRLVETPSGDLWAMSAQGLNMAHRTLAGDYAVDSLSYRNISRRLQNGLGHPCIIDSNHTLFNVDNGFLSVDNFYKPRSNPSRIFVRRILGTNQGDTLLFSLSGKEGENAIILPHSENSIRIDYVWPEYSSDKAVIYSCYLQNYDAKWSNWQEARSKEYTRLHKGTYRFRLRGYNRVSGLTQETTFTIEVQPAWYESWVAYLCYLLLVIAALYLLYRYVRYRYNRRVHRVEMRRERELKEKEALFEIERQKRERELVQVKNEQLELELKHKSSELADSTMNLIRKNDILQALDNDLTDLGESVRRQEAVQLISRKIHDIHHNIQSNIKEDDNWEKFEENFNLVYDNYMQKLREHFPTLKVNDRKLCAYLRMGLSSKEMASLLNTSVRSIETARYRLRKKMELERDDNLTEFIQSL